MISLSMSFSCSQTKLVGCLCVIEYQSCCCVCL